MRRTQGLAVWRAVALAGLAAGWAPGADAHEPPGLRSDTCSRAIVDANTKAAQAGLDVTDHLHNYDEWLFAEGVRIGQGHGSSDDARKTQAWFEAERVDRIGVYVEASMLAYRLMTSCEGGSRDGQE